jgi:hypothetical protein
MSNARPSSEHLRALEQLKTDGLISEEEYNNQAKEDFGRPLVVRSSRAVRRWPYIAHPRQTPDCRNSAMRSVWSVIRCRALFHLDTLRADIFIRHTPPEIG